MDFTAKLLVERTQAGLRASVKEQGTTELYFVKKMANSAAVHSVNE